MNYINPETIINNPNIKAEKVKDPDALILTVDGVRGYYRLVHMNGSEKGFYVRTNRKVY